MWILILTVALTTTSTPRGTVAVSAVHGFVSEQTCRAAAEEFLREKSGDLGRFTKTAQCSKA